MIPCQTTTQTDLFTEARHGYARYALIATSVLLGLMLLGEWTQFSAKQQDAASPPTPMVEQAYAQDTPAAEPCPQCRHRTQTSRSGRTLIYHRPDNKRPLLTWRL